MERSNIKNIFLLILGIFVVFLSLNYINTNIYATDDVCPGMEVTSWECYNYLDKKAKDLQSQQSSLTSKLKAEEYDQLTLTEKISYITNQVEQSEKLIASLEVEISAQTVEVSLLEKDILDKEDSISIMKQEISVLEKSVNQRVEESYKYSFIGTLEIFLNGGTLDNILRRTKYLTATREKDKEALTEMNDRVGELKAEELDLANEKISIEEKKIELEGEKTDLVVLKKSLDVQKIEKNRLLAESKTREQEYREELEIISQAISEVDKIKTDLLYELYKSGALGDGASVKKGQVIGTEGHTGCSYGSHLHYEVRNSAGYRVNPGNGYLNVPGLYHYVTSNTYASPLRGALLSGTYTSSHQALDMVSTTEGNQTYEKYTVPTGLCSIVDWLIATYGNTAYLRGEGAPVYASDAGIIHYKTYSDGGIAALIGHANGNITFYLHLQYVP